MSEQIWVDEAMSFTEIRLYLNSYTFASVCNVTRVKTLADYVQRTHHVRGDPSADRHVHLFSYTIPHLLYTISHTNVMRLAVFRYTAPP